MSGEREGNPFLVPKHALGQGSSDSDSDGSDSFIVRHRGPVSGFGSGLRVGVPGSVTSIVGDNAAGTTTTSTSSIPTSAANTITNGNATGRMERRAMTFSRLGGRLLREEHTHAQVAITAFALGLAAGSAGLCAILVNRYRGLAFYVALLALFHLLEYVTTAMHRLDVSMKAFMLNHSPQYKIALAAGLVEYCLEAVFWPGLKVWRWWNWVGVALVLACQVLRSLAMLTAGANFTHLISFHKERGHVLVTDGIYKVFRHPSYTAFFYYGPCLQLGVLMNPIAFVANVIVLWRFFQDRIGVEEETLVEFFGQEYEAYRTRSYIFIPFIK